MVNIFYLSMQHKQQNHWCYGDCTEEMENISLGMYFIFVLRNKALHLNMSTVFVCFVFFFVIPVINMNSLLVTLSHQINPFSCITCNAHTWHGNITEKRCQLASKVFFLFLKVFWTTSQCASALLLSSSCKASFSTWGYFCSIMYGGGIKTVDAMASPLSVSRAGTRRQMACKSGTQQGTPLGHPHI